MSTLLPGRCVQLNVILIYVGSIQPCCNYCTDCTSTSTLVYNQVFIHSDEWNRTLWSETFVQGLKSQREHSNQTSNHNVYKYFVNTVYYGTNQW